ncbi:Asp-tRNA(Asn)/Glu-tRNA(Gln) amidotransferase subunit GatC [Flammeovirga yaeyamensis]|uniref:Aspartyl/glutamyl-tRNA(Asn/Gln) amidotransferase subunit C n=1 Tax=Flammeovirga yaeyamensis TaxID=367791 RepID=A0AAX1N2Q2_9BACT|nr:Asp-tRNA(Asn)/Glu-tRNA(Gln) amidotransferase subunit GatC [Flammeovirga yaeyamensis]MBB3700791.1 aspartyl-tRNA(Asn)/glutamyl-tRNA(Gln) amidotransferase subunit C [Flammeovirga yaeyamensis]NMF37854.1 Asp-tRNA(Asn)/Glu-tRNA(Gln) amidotransferase subunit GatC [Flammeovirga yaeyamensis]QWG01784.1 Asp-tRNA(Asn)/Glu-tRNA(Gln) amidotransferase subunit GatC [Flammeovirga yaeyamensis]
MIIDKDTIEKIAHLSRLELDKDKEEKMLKSMNEIVEWVAKLEEVDTDGVEPLTHMTVEQSVWRQDEAARTLSHEDALKNAPKKDADYFRVPKVLE